MTKQLNIPKELVIFTDGGSRGNPGPAACAFVACDSKREVVFESGFTLGVQTNNEAEYQGVIHALSWLQELSTSNSTPVDSVTWKLDSKLVVEQLSRRWKIKEQRLRDLAQECWSKLSKLSIKTNFVHVPREQNALADALLNKVLDSAP